MKRRLHTKNDPEDVARYAEAVQLRIQGYTYDEIASRLGYAHKGSAHQAVKAALKRTLQEPTDELRKLELERLDYIMRQLFVSFDAGDMRLSDNILRVIEKRHRLLGLDVPQRGEPIGSEGERFERLMFARAWEANNGSLCSESDPAG